MGKYSKPRGKSTGKSTAKSTAKTAAKQPKKKSNVLLILLCVVVWVLIALIIALWISAGKDPLGGLILENVTIGDVNVGGMTKEEAADALEDSIGKNISQDLVIELPDTTLTLTAADTGAALDIDAAVDAAYQFGRGDASADLTVELSDYLTLNEDYIRSQLDTYCDGYNTDSIQSSITVNGDAPILDTADESFDPEAPCQTITVVTAAPGSHIDVNALYDQILEAFTEGILTVTVEVSGDEPPSTDELAQQLQELYDLHTTEPVDSTLDMETFEASSEVYGYSFDLEAALLQLEEAEYGQTIEIPFQLIAPEVTQESLESVLFRDTLASYETKHTNNSNRNTNLKLACAAINGKVLMPGEQFDYNTALGKRTAEAGYKAADAYSGGQTVQTIGGGICQVSSTLYYCTLIADLQIDTRVAHSYTSSYMPLGMDATVSWGGPHFRFTNNTNYPIRIEAEVSDGYVKIKLIGTDEKDYYVKMEYEVLSNTYAETITKDYAKNNKEGYKDGQVIQTAYNGCEVQSYKCKYDKETDELISREKEAFSRYKKRDKIVVNIVTEETPKPTEAPKPEPTEAPEPEPVETSAPETTPPETAAPESTEAPEITE